MLHRHFVAAAILIHHECHVRCCSGGRRAGVSSARMLPQRQLAYQGDSGEKADEDIDIDGDGEWSARMHGCLLLIDDS